MKRSSALAALADIVGVLVFCTIGRRSHAEGLTVAGVAETAWPFLVGTAVGWLLSPRLAPSHRGRSDRRGGVGVHGGGRNAVAQGHFRGRCRQLHRGGIRGDRGDAARLARGRSRLCRRAPSQS